MNKTLKIAALSAFALIFSGCASHAVHSKPQVRSGKCAAAVHADKNAKAAYELAKQNSEKLDRIWKKSQVK